MTPIAPLIEAFLDETLARQRGVSRHTRDSYAMSFQAIPFKKTDRCLVPYLLRNELQAVLDAPDPATRDGIRDRAMLHLAVCAGLRVSELTGLKIEEIDLPSMSIRVLGKGRRERTLPLWKTTSPAVLFVVCCSTWELSAKVGDGMRD
jgi:site-specific recombinase XerC